VTLDGVQVELAVTYGQVLTFTPGRLVMRSELTGTLYLVLKAKYLGEGRWEALEKEVSHGSSARLGD
jgi:hypothetical protein